LTLCCLTTVADHRKDGCGMASQTRRGITKPAPDAERAALLAEGESLVKAHDRLRLTPADNPAHAAHREAPPDTPRARTVAFPAPARPGCRQVAPEHRLYGSGTNARRRRDSATSAIRGSLPPEQSPSPPLKRARRFHRTPDGHDAGVCGGHVGRRPRQRFLPVPQQPQFHPALRA
jgi:hypothetical protein